MESKVYITNIDFNYVETSTPREKSYVDDRAEISYLIIKGNKEMTGKVVTHISEDMTIKNIKASILSLLNDFSDNK